MELVVFESALVHLACHFPEGQSHLSARFQCLPDLVLERPSAAAVASDRATMKPADFATPNSKATELFQTDTAFSDVVASRVIPPFAPRAEMWS